jgi:hypothetical protein
MDIEFIVQDIFALTRPQWKLASNLEEASRAFQLAVAQDQKNSGLNKPAEVEEPEVDDSSDDDGEALPEPQDSTEDEDADVSCFPSFMAILANFSRRQHMEMRQLPHQTVTSRKRKPSLLLGQRKSLIQKQKQSLSVSTQR